MASLTAINAPPEDVKVVAVEQQVRQIDRGTNKDKSRTTDHPVTSLFLPRQRVVRPAINASAMPAAGQIDSGRSSNPEK